MNIRSTDDLKAILRSAEENLKVFPGVWLGHFQRSESISPHFEKPVSIALTRRFLKKCKKGKVWNSAEMLTALKNAKYGFDSNHPKSMGGKDGIFLLTREHKPRNEMMRKIFDQFLDKPDSGAGDIAAVFGVTLDTMVPVRLVSHHMRLLGLLYRTDTGDALVLVDYDDTK